MTHLQLAEHKGKLSVWYDKRVDPGSNWDEVIRENLESADIVLLAISKGFVESQYIRNVELKYALECTKTGKARIVPVLLERFEADDLPLAHIQALPENAIPVTQWETRDEGWSNVVRGVEAVAESIRRQRKQ